MTAPNEYFPTSQTHSPGSTRPAADDEDVREPVRLRPGQGEELREAHRAESERLIGVLLPLFARYGSPELRRDIKRHRPWGEDMMLSVAALDDVPRVLARERSRV